MHISHKIKHLKVNTMFILIIINNIHTNGKGSFRQKNILLSNILELNKLYNFWKYLQKLKTFWTLQKYINSIHINTPKYLQGCYKMKGVLVFLKGK